MRPALSPARRQLLAWGLGAAILLTLLIYLGTSKEHAYMKDEPIFPGNTPEKIKAEVERMSKFH